MSDDTPGGNDPTQPAETRAARRRAEREAAGTQNSDRIVDEESAVEADENPDTDTDLTVALAEDLTTQSHPVIKSGFEESLVDDADDEVDVPAEPVSSSRIGDDEHVLPRNRRRWWWSRHHSREHLE